MPLTDLVQIRCPYCGESIELLLDLSVSHQVYFEDCSVCCRPIEIGLCLESSASPKVTVRREDDA